MLRLDLGVDLSAATAFLSSTSRRHIPFAASLALNRTATEARDAVRADMPHRFTIRRPWVMQGIGIDRAAKTSLHAAVTSRDAFMADQEHGTSRSGRQIIPVGRAAQAHAGRVIPASLRPKKVYAAGTAVYRAGTLFERRRGKLEALYLFRKTVRIAPRFGMAETVRSVALRRFAEHFGQCLGEALATAR